MTDKPNPDTDTLAMLQAMNAKVDALSRQAVPVAQTNAIRADVPTLRVFLPGQLETLNAGSRRTYASPLRRLCEYQPCLPLAAGEPAPKIGESPDCARFSCEVTHRRLGDTTLEVIVRSDLDRFAAWVQAVHRAHELKRLQERRHAQARADGEELELEDVTVTSRDLQGRIGASGREGAVSAMLWLFAAAEGLWLQRSPATGMNKPRRVRTNRRGFAEDELTAVVVVALARATDPELIRILLRFYYATGPAAECQDRR